MLMGDEHPRKCPLPSCGGRLEGNGLCVSMKLLKGLGGDDRDTFLVTRRWECKDPHGIHAQTKAAKNFHDTDPDMRALLPAHVQER
jgi:hypothetical protein